MRIKIEDKFVNFFNNASVVLKLDSIGSVFSFSTHFSANDPEYQEILKPLQYRKVELYTEENELFFTGNIINHTFKSDKNRNLVTISGYSKAGILEDCTIPLKEYPLESNKQSLLDICTRLCGFYGIKVKVATNISNLVNETVKSKKRNDDLRQRANQVYGRTTASPTETIKDYLARLCSQKNIILSHDQFGNVLLFQPEYDQLPKYFFTKGNTLEMELTFNGQAMHSEIDVITQPSDDDSENVVLNGKSLNTLIPIFRPTSKVLNSGEDFRQTAKNELANELSNIKLTIKLQGIFKNLYPGEIVNIHNHYIYCYAYNRFMIESVEFTMQANEDVTILNCLIPEAFTGGAKIRNILFNHQDTDHHFEPELNELQHDYMNNQTIL